MMRNLIVLGCAGLLAFGLSVSSFAGAPPDADSDGVVDTSDNCVTTANGPLAGTGACVAQEDGNADGYGNICDTDYNNDGATGLDDVATALAGAAVVSTDPNLDPNCDGATGLDDVARTLADAAVVQTPGPSGLACAGTIPCP